MKINLAMWDRLLRSFFGVLLTAWAVAGGPWWAWVGVYMIFTAAWGFCLIYTFLKIRTARISDRPNLPNDIQ